MVQQRIRSLLFAPGSNARILAKVFDAGSDAVDLDLEDAVPNQFKERAREMVRDAVLSRVGKPYPRVVVRLNGPETGLAEDDLDAIVQPGLWGIHLTKVPTPAAIEALDRRIERLERERGIQPSSLRIISSVDSAHLALHLPELVRAPRIYCLIVGGADFAHDLGVPVSSTMAESLWTRSFAVLNSRDAGIAPPLHPSGFNLNDEAAMERLLETGRQIGFQGGIALHPKQLPIIHRVFSPTPAEVQWATEVVAAFAAAEAEGKAALQIDGRFIDYALVRQAEDILHFARDGVVRPE